MIVLDTNVVSALASAVADARVDAWFAAQAGETMIVPVVAIAEVRYGLELLPQGRRRRDLEARFDDLLGPSGGVAVGALDRAAADRAGTFLAMRRRLGRPVALADMMIAGIAAELGAAIATRNVRDFEDLGLTLYDPWSV